MFQELLDNLTNVGVFTSSVQEWVSTLSINKVIIFIMMIFMIVGAIDKIRGNKLGYGEQFDEGFNAMGPLAAAMAGVVAAAPVLAIILKPIIVPIYTLLGADPSMLRPRFWHAIWVDIHWQCRWQEAKLLVISQV